MRRPPWYVFVALLALTVGVILAAKASQHAGGVPGPVGSPGPSGAPGSPGPVVTLTPAPGRTTVVVVPGSPAAAPAKSPADHATSHPTVTATPRPTPTRTRTPSPSPSPTGLLCRTLPVLC